MEVDGESSIPRNQYMGEACHILSAVKKHIFDGSSFKQIVKVFVVTALPSPGTVSNNQSSFGCFQKYGYPKMDGLYWKTLLKWMIWGYPYFWKHPFALLIHQHIFDPKTSISSKSLWSHVTPFLAMDWKRRRTLPTACVKKVAIVGGTHGNETNGVHLAKHFMRNMSLVKRPSFETEVMLSNVAAIQQNTRYVEEDLNRCYLLSDLQNAEKSKSSLERKRALEVDAALGPKSAESPKCDLIIDLHNTTANTGVALLMAPDDQFAHEIGHHLMGLDDSVRVVEWNDQPDWPLCPSIGRSGLTFEVGACPWGCIEPALFQKSRRLVLALLDYVDQHNALITAGTGKTQEVTMKVYRSIGVSMDYPRVDGDPIGHVHPALQNNDFCELNDGDPIFMTFDGKAVNFDRKEHKVPEKYDKVYALFVNEAAYYEKKVALMLMSCGEAQFSKLT